MQREQQQQHDRLADPPLSVARTLAMIPDYRLAHTLAQAERAAVTLAEMIHELRPKAAA